MESPNNLSSLSTISSISTSSSPANVSTSTRMADIASKLAELAASNVTFEDAMELVGLGSPGANITDTPPTIHNAASTPVTSSAQGTEESVSLMKQQATERPKPSLLARLKDILNIGKKSPSSASSGSARLTSTNPTLNSTPKKVNKKDLNPGNSKLLSDKKIEDVKTEFANKPDKIRLQKKSQGYAALKIKDQEGKERYLAVYKGVKQNKHLGVGVEGKAKLAQDLDTGEWVVVKIKDIKGKVDEREYNNLQKAGLLVGRTLRNESIEKKDGTKIHRHQEIIVMKLAKGDTLENTKLKSGEGVKLAKSIISAHKEQVGEKTLLHGDIKTANILYDRTTGKSSYIDFSYAEDAHNITLSNDGSHYSESQEIRALGRVLKEMCGYTTRGSAGGIPKDSNNHSKLIPDQATHKKITDFLQKMEGDNTVKLQDVYAFFESL